ncbi:hypothetical protein WOLCODRAFT_23168, partial [Wolfiporia cocos MD-104 SS10]
MSVPELFMSTAREQLYQTVGAVEYEMRHQHVASTSRECGLNLRTLVAYSCAGILVFN